MKILPVDFCSVVLTFSSSKSWQISVTKQRLIWKNTCWKISFCKNTLWKIPLRKHTHWKNALWKNTLWKNTLEKYTLEKYTVEKYTLETDTTIWKLFHKIYDIPWYTNASWWSRDTDRVEIWKWEWPMDGSTNQRMKVLEMLMYLKIHSK